MKSHTILQWSLQISLVFAQAHEIWEEVSLQRSYIQADLWIIAWRIVKYKEDNLIIYKSLNHSFLVIGLSDWRFLYALM